MTSDESLEELGQRSWVKALADTLLGSSGSAQLRVSPARPDGSTSSTTTSSPVRRCR